MGRQERKHTKIKNEREYKKIAREQQKYWNTRSDEALEELPEPIQHGVIISKELRQEYSHHKFFPIYEELFKLLDMDIWERDTKKAMEKFEERKNISDGMFDGTLMVHTPKSFYGYIVPIVNRIKSKALEELEDGRLKDILTLYSSGKYKDYLEIHDYETKTWSGRTKRQKALVVKIPEKYFKYNTYVAYYTHRKVIDAAMEQRKDFLEEKLWSDPALYKIWNREDRYRDIWGDSKQTIRAKIEKREFIKEVELHS